MKKGEMILAFGVFVFSVMLATMVSAQESYPTALLTAATS